MVLWITRPSLVLGDNSDHDLFQLFPIRDRLGSEVGDVVVGNADRLFTFAEDYRHRLGFLDDLRRGQFVFRQV